MLPLARKSKEPGLERKSGALDRKSIRELARKSAGLTAVSINVEPDEIELPWHAAPLEEVADDLIVDVNTGLEQGRPGI